MTPDTFNRVLQKLAKWRTVFASWQCGTRADTDGEINAIKDHREVTILLRAEVNALTALLVAKGVFTEEGFRNAVGLEADNLDRDYRARFPGFRTSEVGVHMDLPAAADTMKRLHFPK
jgi:hypothetical protein